MTTLSELRGRGINLAASALAQSTDHILSFFNMLRAELGFYVAWKLGGLTAGIVTATVVALAIEWYERRHGRRGSLALVSAALFGAMTVAVRLGFVREGDAALARRAPVDLRINTLKATSEKVLKALRRFEPSPTPHSPVGVRIVQAPGPGKSPHVEAEPGHGKGWYEVQDEGSQVATLLSGAKPKAQIIDLCAGAGGKTLGLAALMQNTGQLYAYDADRLRLRPIFERLKRAGVRNAQVLPAGDAEALAKLDGKMDLVLIDAPCTGSGVWRRRPDAKWRLGPQMLEARLQEQAAVLDEGAALVKPGGRLAYITCSVLPPENRDQVEAFLGRHPEFKLMPWRPLWDEALSAPPLPSADGAADTLLMTPLSHGTDGFFVAVLERQRG